MHVVETNALWHHTVEPEDLDRAEMCACQLLSSCSPFEATAATDVQQEKGVDIFTTFWTQIAKTQFTAAAKTVVTSRCSSRFTFEKLGRKLQNPQHVLKEACMHRAKRLCICARALRTRKTEMSQTRGQRLQMAG
jgi:hypothetical protein